MPKTIPKRARAQKAVLDQIRVGKYGPEGYPSNSPLLKKAFEKVEQFMAEDAKIAAKLYG